MRRFSLLWVLCWATPALADDSHYQDYVIGGRAMGLGGAYTSIADDPAGLYYNPAGIVDTHQKSFQVSTSLYGFERGSIDKKALTLPLPGVEKLQIEFTELIIVPATAGFVNTFGGKGPDGLPYQAYSVSVLVPSFRSFQINSPPTRAAGVSSETSVLIDQPPTYSRRVTDRSLWSGVGYARKFGDLRLGVGGYYILRTGVDIEKVATSATIDADGDGLSGDQEHQVYRSATNDISYLNGNILGVVGAKLKLTPRITVGASFLTPSVKIHSQSSLRFTSGDSAPACAELGLSPEREAMCESEPLLAEPRSRFVSETIDGASETRYAPTIRAGASYSSRYRFTLSADASYHLPVSYSLITAKRLDAKLKSRLPFNPEIERRGVLNLNGGVEYLIIRDVSIAAGFFTDNSSAPKITQENPTVDQQPRVHMKGFTMALGYFAKHSLSRLGVLYCWGDGRDVIPTNEISRVLEQQQSFQRVDYFQSFFYVFLSSTFRY